MAALSAAETIVGGITSNEGLTLDKGKEAWEQLKSGLMYNYFAAYVSGPLGNAVQKVLSKNPNFFKSIISSHKFTLVAGTTTETTADVLFDRLTSDLSLRESLEQNGLMNFGMMIAGARMHGASQNASALANVKIEKMKDGTYNIKENNRVLCKARDENELAFVVLSLAKEKNAAQNAAANKQTPITETLKYTKKSILELIETNPELKNNQWVQDNIPQIIERCSGKWLYKNLSDKISHPLLIQHRMKILNTFLSDPKIYNDPTLQKDIAYIIADGAKDSKSAQNINESLVQYANLKEKNNSIKDLADIVIANTNISLENKQKLYDYLLNDPNDYKDPRFAYARICGCVTDQDIDLVLNVLKEIPDSTSCAECFLNIANKENDIAARMEIYNTLKEYPDISTPQKSSIISNTVSETLEFRKQMLKEFYSNQDIPKEYICDLVLTANTINIDFMRKLIKDKTIPWGNITPIVQGAKEEALKAIEEVYNSLKNNSDFPKEYISKILMSINEYNPDYAMSLCQNYKKMELQVEEIPFLLKNYKIITAKDLQKLYRVMGREKAAKLSYSDFIVAAQMVDIYGKTNLNEIPMEGKQNLLRKLVACNEGLFNISDDLKKHFPLIPTDRETYCSLLPAIVKSLGVDIRTIEPPKRITEFNQNMSSLASNLAKLSDTDFSNLQIRQEYSKDEFITNVLEKTKKLSRDERQKVYDYFGFELHHNKTNQTGFSITGYPVNLNNGKKLADITDPNTKAVVESLRPDVIRFSEQNPIKCNNPQVEKLLNDIVDIIPELRTEIGKTQHGAHDYDVFTHSLKVMQKVAQEPKFQTLNDSDKKIMMLASLLHDVTKKEGFSDRTHAAQGSFDTFFISKKFNLTRDEEIKLYTLTRHHEWLAYANTAISEADLTKRLQSVAYDLQYDNLFDMALMFTHADLKAVKTDNSFHDSAIGKARTDFNGNVRSFGQSADIYAQRIRGYIDELKASQPILPVTKVPRASKINQAITTVNPDGSTNIKGVYKRSDGLVVIKFNEVKDWEAIGFPQGSVSRGYTARAGSGKKGSEFTENVNTGNIKFFVHGLDYENQLAKFDAFSQIDSDVLLSVSYAERPESKYRFFRSQGVVLDFDTKYIHGGGNTDAGSGCGKFIEDFKRDYVFGGRRESDRVYVSNLVKEATGMNDAEYVRFVEANKNKSLNEIEPPEYREPLIKAYASINSNTRKGNRAYNEMYGSNPREVMAVFAYDMDTNGTIGNPLDFLGKTEIGRADRGYNGAQRQSAYDRTKFLQDYAIEHDIPFIVFGD